jgi:hypothetical protein
MERQKWYCGCIPREGMPTFEELFATYRMPTEAFLYFSDLMKIPRREQRMPPVIGHMIYRNHETPFYGHITNVLKRAEKESEGRYPNIVVVGTEKSYPILLEHLQRRRNVIFCKLKRFEKGARVELYHEGGRRHYRGLYMGHDAGHAMFVRNFGGRAYQEIKVPVGGYDVMQDDNGIHVSYELHTSGRTIPKRHEEFEEFRRMLKQAR